MKKILIHIILLFFTATTFAARYPFIIEIDLNKATINHTLPIQITTPRITESKIKFLIPVNVPGSIAELRMGKLFSNIKAINSKGESLPVIKNNENEYEIHNDGSLEKITYDVHDSWTFDSLSGMPMPQLGTYFIKDSHFLFNFQAIVGYIDGFEDYSFNLQIKKPLLLNTFSGMSVTNLSGIDYLELPNYFALIDNPMVYSTQKETSFLIGKTRYNIMLYSENNEVKIEDILATIKEVCGGVDEFCGGLNLREYTFMFHFMTPGKKTVAMPEEYGAVQHSRSGIYYFQESENKFRIERDIQFTTAHELFHLYEPFNLKTDATYRYNLKGKVTSANVWIYEGFTEYFSLLMQLHKGMITEAEFLDEMKNKITVSQNFEPFNLYDESERSVIEGNIVKYKNFYNKAAVTAMMLDLRLIKLSKGEMNLQSLMQDIYNSSQKNYVLKDNMLTDEIVRFSHPEVKTFIDRYVKDTITIPYSDYLATAGYTYSQVKNDTSNLYVNAKYRYSRQGNEYFVTNISFNQIGLRDGDILVKIGGQKITKDNLEDLLAKYSDINYSKKVKFTIKRNGKEIELSGEPLRVTKNQKNLILVNSKMDTDTKNNHRLFTGGNGSKSSKHSLLNYMKK